MTSFKSSKLNDWYHHFIITSSAKLCDYQSNSKLHHQDNLLIKLVNYQKYLSKIERKKTVLSELSKIEKKNLILKFKTWWLIPSFFNHYSSTNLDDNRSNSKRQHQKNLLVKLLNCQNIFQKNRKLFLKKSMKSELVGFLCHLSCCSRP